MMAEHYYTASPDSRSEVRTIEYTLGDRQYRFYTDHGVFSITRVDYGSDLLIRAVLADYEEKPCVALLDLGCGYGPIGIVLSDRLRPEKAVLMDINTRAMDLARRGLTENRIRVPWEVVTEDALRDQRFSLIVTNPPIRAGKKTVYGFFALAKERLRPDGCFYAVIRKNQGADSAAKELKRLFGNCETIARSAGFHVLKAKAGSDL